MLGQIVIDHERMPLGVAEVFSHGAGGIRGDVLHGRGLRSRRSHHDCVVHGTGVSKNFYYLGNRRPFLPDRVVATDQVIAFIVDYGVQRDRGLTSLLVANDQFALSPAITLSRPWTRAIPSPSVMTVPTSSTAILDS